MLRYPFALASAGCRQRGMTLIELLGGMLIFGLFLAGMADLMNRHFRSARNQVAGEHIALIGKAGWDYYRKEQSALEGDAAITAVRGRVVTVADLIAGGYLPAGTAAQNRFGQNICIYIRKIAVGTRPVVQTLVPLLVTEGGSVLDDADLAEISRGLGAWGAAFYSPAFARQVGFAVGDVVGVGYGTAQGAWRITATDYEQRTIGDIQCNGQAGGRNYLMPIRTGHVFMALWLNGDRQPDSSEFLFRTAQNNEERNTMRTPIVLADARRDGEVCANVGAITSEVASGQILACINEGGAAPVWRRQALRHWRPPVSNFAALRALTAAERVVGDVRVTKDTNRAFMWSGLAWEALAVDQDGNLGVPGQLKVGQTTTGWKVLLAADAENNALIEMKGAADGNSVFLQNRDGVFRIVKQGLSSPVMSVAADGSLTTAGDKVQFRYVSGQGAELQLGGEAAGSASQLAMTMRNVNGVWKILNDALQAVFAVDQVGNASVLGRLSAALGFSTDGDMAVTGNVSSDGNVSARGDLSSRQLSASGNLNSSGTITANGQASAGSARSGILNAGSASLMGNVSVNGGITVAGNAAFSGNIDGQTVKANEYVQINGQVTAGGVCPGKGLMSRDDSGKLLSCVLVDNALVWRYANGVVSIGNNCTSVRKWPPRQTVGEAIGRPSDEMALCPAGYYLVGLSLDYGWDYGMNLGEADTYLRCCK